jgi:hypothetical protein
MKENPMESNTLAWQLWTYIQRRAKVEGVAFDLSIDLFRTAVHRGAKTFGVVHDGHEMLYDEQEPYPGFFEQVKTELMERQMTIRHLEDATNACPTIEQQYPGLLDTLYAKVQWHWAEIQETVEALGAVIREGRQRKDGLFPSVAAWADYDDEGDLAVIVALGKPGECGADPVGSNAEGIANLAAELLSPCSCPDCSPQSIPMYEPSDN